jgi:hypothetical protein
MLFLTQRFIENTFFIIYTDLHNEIKFIVFNKFFFEDPNRFLTITHKNKIEMQQKLLII